MTDINRHMVLLEGLQRLQTGTIDHAASCFLRVLQSDPDNLDALHLLGVARLRQGNVTDGVALLVRAVTLKPDFIDALIHLGMALRGMKENVTAADCFRRVLGLRPDHVAAAYNLGNTQMDLNDLQGAIESYRVVTTIEPSNIAAFTNLGLAYSWLGRIDDAMSSYDQALKLDPNAIEALCNKGALLLQTGDSQAAIASLRRVLALQPGRTDIRLTVAKVMVLSDDLTGAANQYGLILEREPNNAAALVGLGTLSVTLGDPVKAEKSFRAALPLDPENSELLQLLGTLLSQQGRFDESALLYRRAVALTPDLALAHYNLGVALTELHRFEDALPSFQRTVALAPDMSAGYSNLGLVLRELGRAEEAVDAFGHAVDNDLDDPVPLWNQSLARLALGDFIGGWEGYEARWRLPAYARHRRDFAMPQWRGENLIGKSILVHAEQGFGDTIQMARYISWLNARGAWIALEVQPALFRLMATLPILVEIIPQGSALPPVDFHCPMMSLPLGFSTQIGSIPMQIPYLQADQARAADYRQSLGLTKSRRIGLVWAGAKTHQSDRYRSIELADLEPLLQIDDIDFVSLQREVPPSDRAQLDQDQRLINAGEKFADFSETAAAIEVLDLVITVDTAVAHLAGAMGKPVWVLLPFYPDWRWLLDRDDSPWYPTARLFRQSSRADWGSVIEQVAAALND